MGKDQIALFIRHNVLHIYFPIKENLSTDIVATKTSFIAGIIVFFVIIKDLFTLFNLLLPRWVILVFNIFILICTYIIFRVHKLDDFFKKKGTVDFGNFLTIMSIFIYIMENVIAGIGIKELDGMLKFILTIVVIPIIGGSLTLLFQKQSRSKGSSGSKTSK